MIATFIAVFLCTIHTIHQSLLSEARMFCFVFDSAQLQIELVEMKSQITNLNEQLAQLQNQLQNETDALHRVIEQKEVEKERTMFEKASFVSKVIIYMVGCGVLEWCGLVFIKDCFVWFDEDDWLHKQFSTKIFLFS
jgi:hypothetical protein